MRHPRQWGFAGELAGKWLRLGRLAPLAVCLVVLGGATAAAPGNALQLNGTNEYVRFGTAQADEPMTDALNASNFTLEVWFKRSGTGRLTSTGTGGVNAAPLLAKGREERERSDEDVNYFLGIDANGKLVADFEEGAGQPSPGLNHPVTGVTTITNNFWHHAAATYDGQTWKLYLDGKLDTTLTLSGLRLPRSDSIQRTALGSALNSNGSAAGFFQGTVDEVRIWNVARTGAQIRANRNVEITSPASGLIGRWGLDEGSGNTTADSSASGVTGRLVSSPTWVAGYAFPQDTIAPGAVQNVTETEGDATVSLSWSANLDIDLAGYNVYRASSPPVPTSGTPVNGADLLEATIFNDSGLTNGATYYYAVVAVDRSNNSSAPTEASATPRAVTPGQAALEFAPASSEYVTFGAALGLDASEFTVETWFRRTGAGVGASTGTDGLVSAVPLVTKGRAEAETPANLNMNYFLGIDSVTNVLMADFEDTVDGGNHPVAGVTPIAADNEWHHAAATYDGTTWRLYLDGKLDRKLTIGSFAPESTSIQHAAVASALDSTGSPAGFFQGELDETRIWDVLRTGAQIRSAKDDEIIGPTSGLQSRWGYDEAGGSTAADSSGNAHSGTLVNTPSWVPGYAFPQDPFAPAAPTNLTATAGDSSVSLTWTANGEADFAGYNVFRSTSSPVSTAGTPLNGADLVSETTFDDTTAVNWTTYYYVVVAADTADNVSGASNEANATPPPGGRALAFDGSSRYITFGQATSTLGATTLTLETWFRRTGAGIGTNTGIGGFASAIPLVTKGRGEDESSNVNMNYFLGIDSGTNVLVADFEDTATGENHPASGTTALAADGSWHHAAATYDGTTWRLYLDGRLEAKTVVGAFTPRSDSIQHAALASALDSTGVADGFFAGELDEARVWNYARPGSQIRSAKDDEITGPQTGLLARWGLDETSGTSVGDTSGNNVTGTTVGNPSHVAGYGFPQDTTAPPAPTSLDATAGDSSITLAWTASADPDIAGYDVFRSTASPVGASGSPLNGSDLVTGTTFTDTTATNGTPYHYAVRAVDTADNASGLSNEDSAMLDPVFVGAGDIAYTWSSDESTAQLLDGIPGAVFTLGDNVYLNGTASEFASHYEPTWGRHKSRTRPAPGNHDYNTANATGYFDYFNGVGIENGPAGNRDLGYYSYDITSGPVAWHVVVLNSECEPVSGLWLPNGCAAGSVQEQWLRNDLENAATNNIIALSHKPRWSSSGNQGHMQALWHVLYDYGVDIALGGHWHNYERLAPMNARGNADASYGIREFVVGTGGATLRNFGSPLATSEVRNSTTHGVIKFTLHASSYDWEFVPIAGQTFTDSGTQAVHGPPDTTAPAVDVVSAVPSTLGPSDPSTLVTWNASESGNFSVRVGATSCATPLLLSLRSDGAAGELAVANEDIVAFDGTDFTLLLDGSDVGLDTLNLDAFAFLDHDSLLLSFEAAGTIGLLGTVDDSDVVRFDASSLGDVTAGTFSMLLDGSDVGLTTDSEDVDAVQLLASGELMLSTIGNPAVAGFPLGSLGDEDLLAFTPISLGDTTGGSWALHFDGSDVGLTGTYDDVDAGWTAGNGDLYLSTQYPSAAPGFSVANEDVFVFTPSTLGAETAGTYSSTLLFDGSTNGLAAYDVDGVGRGLPGTQVDSGTYSTAPADTTSTVAAGDLSEGENTIRVCVTDGAGNTGSDTIQVSKNTAGPPERSARSGR